MKETRAAFARRLGVEKSTITRAVQAGRLVIDADGLLDVDDSLRRWKSTQAGRTDVAARHAAHRSSVGRTPAAAPDRATSAQREADTGNPDRSGLNATPSAEGSRTRFKAMVLQYENQTLKLEMALRRGLRYSLAEVSREAQSIGAMLRAGFERLIDQTAPRLAVAADRSERRRLIDAELRALRNMVKSEFPRALRRIRQAGRGKGQP